MEKKFSYEIFCEYVKNKMSIIIEGDVGEFIILEDTQSLQEFGFLTEEEALRHIYNNNLFEALEEVILMNLIPHSFYEKLLKLFQEESQVFNNGRELKDAILKLNKVNSSNNINTCDQN